MQPTPEGRPTEPAAGSSAGALLKNARQQRGLHIAALAVMLKVPQAKLEAIEADRWDELPDATFARALATAMCRALKVDPAPVLALLPRQSGLEFDVRPGLNQPFRERGGPVDGGALAMLAKPVVWGPALLLIAAAAIYWVPAGWLPDREATVSTAPAPASAVPAEFIPAPAASEVASAPPMDASASALAVAPAPASAVVASAPLQVREVPAPTVTPMAPVGGGSLRVSATADSWVEVVDAQGQVLLSRVLRTGEQQEFAGAPLKLRVGNVSGTRVEWRGAALNLSERSKDNVARLELN